MHQEMQIIDSLIYMPVAEIPGFVVNHLFYRVRPVLCAVIHGGSDDSGEETLGRYILKRAVVREYHVHRMRFAQLLDIFLDRRSRLLIRPLIVSHAEAVKLIHAVSTADHNALFALYIEYITINREQDIREVLLVQHTTTVPLLFRLGIKMIFLPFLLSNVHSIQWP